MNIRLPIELIRKAQQEGWIGSLGYLANLKRYRTTYYNFSYQSVSKLLGCSKSTLKRNLDILRHHNLCYFKDRNLCLVGTYELQQRFENKKLVQIKLIHGKRKLSIEYALVSEKLNSQQYYIDRLAELKQLTKLTNSRIYIEKRQYKRFQQLRLLFKKRSMQKDYQCLSVFGFGKVLGNHYTTGHRKRNQLKELGVIDVKPRKEMIKGKTFFDFKYMKAMGLIPIYAKFSKGNIFTPTASEIQILTKEGWGQ